MKEGWTYKKLGEVCNIDFGTRVVRSRDAGSIYPVYGGGGATFKMDMYNREDCMVISRFGMSEQCTRFVKGKFFLNDSGLTLSLKENCMIQEFMDWQILYLNNTIYSLGRGAAQKNLDTKALAEVRITYPNNLSEQQRIVSRLDSAFDHIDALKANAEKQLSEARALFQKALAKAMEPKEGWEEKRLMDVVVSITDGDHQPPPKSPEGIPFITITNIDKNLNKIVFEDTFYVPQSYFSSLKEDRIPQKGDVLYTVTGSFGIPVLIDFDKNFCFQRHIALIRPNNGLLSSTYLFYWILSSYATSQAEDTATGAAQRTVSLKSLRNFKIYMPSLSEQRRIVARLDSLSKNVRKYEEIQKKVIAECDNLKQALLRKVFE